MTEPVLEWVELLKLAATAGVTAAVVTQGMTWLREWRASGSKKKASAAYLAVRVAVALEAFSETCSEIVGDIVNYESSGGNVGSPRTDLPAAPTYPTDEESWRSMDLVLVEKVLSFPNRVGASQKAVGYAGEYGDGGDEMTRMCLEQACERGIEAWDLAVALREKYGFPSYAPAVEYVDFLRKEAEEAKGRRRKDQEENARAWESMNAASEQAKAAAAQAASIGSTTP
ncbi:hypothetical protein [Bosea sp. NPDC055594]